MIDTRIVRGEWKLTGIERGTGTCDRCAGELTARVFEITHKTTGETLTTGRRCTARATGYPIGRLEHLAAAERRIAEVNRREAVVLAEFPRLMPVFLAANVPGSPYPPAEYFVFQTSTTEDMFWREGSRREGGWRGYLRECLPAELLPAA